jgi:hypothetical protein
VSLVVIVLTHPRWHDTRIPLSIHAKYHRGKVLKPIVSAPRAARIKASAVERTQGA